MDARQVANVVADLTGGWSVHAGSKAADLQAARLALASAVGIGKGAEELDRAHLLRPKTATDAALSHTIAGSLATPPPPNLAFIQSTLAASVTNPLGTPAWAQGMKVAQQLGPFVDANGLGHLVFTLPLTVSRKFAFGAASAPFGVFPVPALASHPTTSLRLGAGSVWFFAKMLAHAIADGNFSGFRISGGTLQSSAPMNLQGDTWVIPANATLTLTATLVPPANGTSSPGADLTTAKIALPASVTIQFTATVATVEALSDSTLTLYSTPLKLSWNKKPPAQVKSLPWLLIPCAASTTSFGFTSVHSSVFTPDGRAPIQNAGWALPIATTTIAALGEASGAGALFLVLGSGATLKLETRPQPAAVAEWLISIDPTALGVLAAGRGSAGHTTFELWPEEKGARDASVDWINRKAFEALFLAAPGKEIVTITGNTKIHFDRPLAADGGRLPISAAALLIITLDGSSHRVSILGIAPSKPEIFPLALANALIGARLPRLFLITMQPAGKKVVSANVILLCDTRWLLPTLPDPYAANFDISLVEAESERGVGSLGIGLNWDQGKPVAITLGIGPPLPEAAPASADGNVAHPAAVAAMALPQAAPPVAVTTQTSFGFALLDLSTRVDQFGVMLPFMRGQEVANAAPPVGFVDLLWAVNGGAIMTFGLPQLSWEPMQSTGPAPPLGPVHNTPPGDGPPLLLRAADEQILVPVAPLPVLRTTIQNVEKGKPFQALFSLPFGLIAQIDQPNEPPSKGHKAAFLRAGGVFGLVRPEFDGKLKGALQVTLKPPHPSRPNAQFSGITTFQSKSYIEDVLSSDVAKIFDGEFGQVGTGAVPVRRADLAGYGASIFSEWQDSHLKGTGIVKTHFETIVGRTRYEVVQAQTHLHPYSVRLVRTITIERQNTGWVRRTDTGWQPASEGIFAFDESPNDWAGRVHRGAVAGVFNIRNIREFETVGPFNDGFSFRLALFDADIGIDHRVKVRSGGAASTLIDADGKTVTLVPARDLTGYVQLTPVTTAGGPAPPPMLPDNMADLLANAGPVTANFACVAELGGTASAPGTILRCAAIEVDMVLKAAGGEQVPALGAALRGVPQLPRDGAWSVGRRPAGQTAPAALPKEFAVPVVRPNGNADTWHFADITDVLQLGSPDHLYGLLQDTGTQKMLFEQPTVPDFSGAVPPGAVPGLKLPAGTAPAFADVASLLNATGLFPDLSAAINLNTGASEQLKTLEQGLEYSKTYAFNLADPPTTLLNLGVIRVELSYANANHTEPTKFNFKLDPAHTDPAGAGRNWWFTIEKLSFMVIVPEFAQNPLLTIEGGFKADEHTAPTLSDLNLVYGDALASLKSIFSRLSALASFLPGGAGAGLDVSLSEGRLTVHQSFAIPTLPLGIGELSDITLELGLALTLSPLSADFSIGIGDPEHPFTWIVSPLAGNGMIDIGVKGGKRLLVVQAGIGLGLAINIGIAEGSASITIAVKLQINGSAITLMAILTGQASVDVLGGLVGAALTLTAAVGISVDPPPLPHPSLHPIGITFPEENITFLAAVSVGIHISICWVVSVDWDGSWQFSQTIHTPAITVGT